MSTNTTLEGMLERDIATIQAIVDAWTSAKIDFDNALVHLRLAAEKTANALHTARRISTEQQVEKVFPDIAVTLD